MHLEMQQGFCSRGWITLVTGNNKEMPNVPKQAEFLLELGNVVEDVGQWNLERFLWLKELGQESTSKKGQAEEESEESESTCSPLTLPGVQPAEPGEINTTPRHRVKSLLRRLPSY